VAAKLGYDLANKISDAFVSQVNENMHLRQLSQQTGLTTEAVYKLGAAATLSGTSLEAIADSNQRLSDELIGGISDKKAQLLMALNINPREALLQTGGDIGKLNQLIFERMDKATKGAPAYIRSSIESLGGFNPEEQTARRYLYTNGVQNRAQQVLDKATHGGKVPFQTGSNLQDEILKVIGAKLDIAAAIRAALTASGAAAAIAVETMTLKAGVVNLSADFISKMGGLINSPSNEQLKENQQRNIKDFNKRFGEDLTNTFGPQNTTFNTFSSAVTKASGTGG
jgi:hypothetical protein